MTQSEAESQGPSADDTLEAWNRSTGMVLGKFYPPTLGHCYLVDFARHYVGHLTVIVASLSNETIPGETRAAWMREMFPDAHVIHTTDEIPQDPGEPTNLWRIWRDTIRRVLPEGPDYLFASEAYGSNSPGCWVRRTFPWITRGRCARFGHPTCGTTR